MKTTFYSKPKLKSKLKEPEYVYTIDIDYCCIESTIKGFLLCSALGRMNEFDFNEAFENNKYVLENKLDEHGQLGYDRFKGLDDVREYHSDSEYEAFAVITDYMYFGLEDVKECICKGKYEKCRQSFDGMFDDLIGINDAINNRFNSTVKNDIILFDSLIHAQHQTGMLFDDINIEDIKEETEELIKELLNL